MKEKETDAYPISRLSHSRFQPVALEQEKKAKVFRLLVFFPFDPSPSVVQHGRCDSHIRPADLPWGLASLSGQPPSFCLKRAVSELLFACFCCPPGFRRLVLLIKNDCR